MKEGLDQTEQVEMFTCTMCGYRFDPSQRTACSGCPVQRGCQLICCPSCGFETVDPSRSTLARLAGLLFSKGKKTISEQESEQEIEG
ncbi:MAG: hypothetical protein P8074_11155 [Anaerolineales bacterium]|jgi:hypothetical protein